MARRLPGYEVGVQLLSKNGNSGASILFGSAAPGGETYTEAAEVGSTYMRTDGSFYLKDVTGAGTDKWVRMASLNDITNINWRSEKVICLTADAAPATGSDIDLVANPFGDDDVPTLTAADFAVGTYILFGAGGTEKLMRVSAIAAPEITVVDPLAETNPPLVDGDAFMVRNYLPDSPGAQEKQALVLYNGTDYVKIGDVNWDIATGINLSASYTPGTGNVTTADTVESAIQKLDGNIDNLTAAVGIAQGDTTMGDYTGVILTDTETAKQNLQELADWIEDLNGGQTVREDALNVTTEVMLDEVLVDDVIGAVWQVVFHDKADPTLRKMVRVNGTHNGTPAADADDVDDSVTNILKITPPPVGGELRVDISGAGGTQKMQLLCKSTGNAMDFYSIRTDVRL